MEKFPEQRIGQIIFNAMHEYTQYKVGAEIGRAIHCEIFYLPNELLAESLLYYSTIEQEEAHINPPQF